GRPLAGQPRARSEAATGSLPPAWRSDGTAARISSQGSATTKDGTDDASPGPRARSEGRSIRARSGSLGRDGLDLASALFVGLDHLLQIAVLLAWEEAELVEDRQVLLRFRQVVEGQIRLADVLVSAAVLGVDRQRLFVDGNRLGGIAVLAGRVRE